MLGNGITVKPNNIRPSRTVITFDLPGYGHVAVTLAALLTTLDEMAMHDTDAIRAIVTERIAPATVPAWADRTELAAIWADCEHNHDNDPLRAE